MPIYNFQCQACGHPFEELVSKVDDIPACPRCDSDHVDKALSVPADFKGEYQHCASPCEKCSDATAGCCGGACAR